VVDRQATGPAARLAFYERYQETRGAVDTSLRSETEALLELVKRYQLEEGRVLEVGCGRGAFQELADGWVASTSPWARPGCCRPSGTAGF